jgi:hypothetical protein
MTTPMDLDPGILPGLAELQRSDAAVAIGGLPQFNREDLPPSLPFQEVPFPSFPIDLASLPQAMVIDPPPPPPVPPFCFDTKESLAVDILHAFSEDNPETPLAKQALNILKNHYIPQERIGFFEECLKQQRLHIAESLITHSVVDCDDQDINGNTPLHHAANYKASSLLKIMIPKSLDVDAKNKEGETPFHYVVKRGVLDSVVALMEAGANLNTETNEKWTPIEFCFAYDHAEILKAMLSFAKEKNIEIDFTDACTTYSLLSAQDRQKFDKISSDFARVKDLKQAGHIWGLEGTFRVNQLKSEFEGYPGKVFLNDLLMLLKGCFSQLPSNHPFIGINDRLREVEKNMELSIKEKVEKIRKGEVVFFPVSWKGHFVMLIFAGNRVYKCNRGDGSGDMPGVLAYEMQATDRLEEVLTALQNADRTPANQLLFNITMNQQLGLKFICLLPMKCQKVGNCAKASVNAAIFALLFEEALRIYPNLQQAYAEAKGSYKSYTHTLRMASLDCQVAAASPNRPFLEKVHEVLMDPLRLPTMNLMARIHLLRPVKRALGLA